MTNRRPNGLDAPFLRGVRLFHLCGEYMSSTCLSMVFSPDKASINRGGVRSNLGANASAKVVFEVVQDHAGPLLGASFYLLKHFHAGSQPRRTLSVK